MSFMLAVFLSSSQRQVRALVARPSFILLSRRLSVSSALLDKPTRVYTTTNTDNTGTVDRDWMYVMHLAEDAARRAGDVMRDDAAIRRGKISSTAITEKANVRDVVTDADVACQNLILSTIQAIFPNDVFLGEESVAPGSQASINALQQALENVSDGVDTQRVLWAVDPIDGTTNMYCGLPMFCASIGVVAYNSTSGKFEIKVGVIYNPVLDEMTSAVAGQGAFVNGKRLVTTPNITTDSTTMALNESVVNVGFPVVKESTLRASSKAVAALATKVRGLRMIACASQVVAWVARNNMQCYVSWDLNAWDVCAGMLIARESGGTVVDFDGKEATIESRDLIFTSPQAGMALAEEIRQVLKDNDCLDYDRDGYS